MEPSGRRNEKHTHGRVLLCFQMLTWAVSFPSIPEKEKDVGQVRLGVGLGRNQLQVAEIMVDDFSRKCFKQIGYSRSLGRLEQEPSV